MLCADYSTQFLLESVPGLQDAKERLEMKIKQAGEEIEEPGLMLIILDDDPGGVAWREWKRNNRESERINDKYVLVLANGKKSAVITYALDPDKWDRDYIIKKYRERGYYELTDREFNYEYPEEWENRI